MTEESKQLPLREEVPVEKTWDLTTIYKSDDEWEAAYEEVAKKVEAVSKYEGICSIHKISFS